MISTERALDTGRALVAVLRNVGYAGPKGIGNSGPFSIFLSRLLHCLLQLTLAYSRRLTVAIFAVKLWSAICHSVNACRKICTNCLTYFTFQGFSHRTLCVLVFITVSPPFHHSNRTEAETKRMNACGHAFAEPEVPASLMGLWWFPV